MTKNNFETPFESNLAESHISKFHEGKGKLMKLDNRPDKIIRVETFDNLETRFNKKLVRLRPLGLETDCIENWKMIIVFRFPWSLS